MKLSAIEEIDPLFKYIGDRIGRRRTDWLMSRERLGELLGMGEWRERRIKSIEEGSTEIDLRLLYDIADALKCDLYDLIPIKMSDDLKPFKGHLKMGTKVIPKKGRFKGKVGTIVEKAWSWQWIEWNYIVRFVQARHVFRECELDRIEETEGDVRYGA